MDAVILNNVTFISSTFIHTALPSFSRSNPLVACSEVPSIDLNLFPKSSSASPGNPLEDSDEDLDNEARDTKLKSMSEIEDTRGEEKEKATDGPPPLSLIFPESPPEGKESKGPAVGSREDEIGEPTTDSTHEIEETRAGDPDDIEKKGHGTSIDSNENQVNDEEPEDDANLQMELKHLIDILKSIEKRR